MLRGFAECAQIFIPLSLIASQALNAASTTRSIEAGQRDLYPQKVELSPFLREMADMLEPQARLKSIVTVAPPSSSMSR